MHVFLVMEYCEGGDLSSFIHSHQRLRESLARRFLRQLGKVLAKNIEAFTRCFFEP